MLLTYLNCKHLNLLAQEFKCVAAPEDVGDVVNCEEYAVYLNYREGDMCYVGITHPDLWVQPYEYLSHKAQEEGRYNPGDALRLLQQLLNTRLRDAILAAVATRAPSVRDDTGDSAFIHHDWLWVKKGVELTGKIKELYDYITSFTLDVFPLTKSEDVDFMQGRLTNPPKELDQICSPENSELRQPPVAYARRQHGSPRQPQAGNPATASRLHPNSPSPLINKTSHL